MEEHGISNFDISGWKDMFGWETGGVIGSRWWSFVYHIEVVQW